MNPLLNMLINKAQSNPNIANSPRNKEIMRVLQNGTQEERENMARNLAQSYGCNNVDDAVKQAKNFFGKQRLI